MKIADHKRLLKAFLEHSGDNEFTLAFFREVALSNPTVFNKICDKLTGGPLAPFRCMWKEQVMFLLRSNNKLEAIKYIREYSRENPSLFGKQAMALALDGKPMGLGLRESKDLVESLDKPATA